MRQILPVDYMQMLGERDAIVFLLDEENTQLKTKIAEMSTTCEMIQERLIESEKKIAELTDSMAAWQSTEPNNG